MKPVLSICAFALAIVLMRSNAFQALAMDRVLIETQAGVQTWQVELASDGQSRAKGLMFRESMAEKSEVLCKVPPIPRHC